MDDFPADDSDPIEWWLQRHFDSDDDSDDDAADICSDDEPGWEWLWVDWPYLRSLWARAIGATHLLHTQATGKVWEPIHDDELTAEHSTDLQRLTEADLSRLNRELLWFNRIAIEAINWFASGRGVSPNQVLRALADHLGVELVLDEGDDDAF